MFSVGFCRHHLQKTVDANTNLQKTYGKPIAKPFGQPLCIHDFGLLQISGNRGMSETKLVAKPCTSIWPNTKLHVIQLYQNQVFVTDNVEGIVPEFLTLLRGVIDSPDIPLNVSRSYLQADSAVKKN